MSRKHTSSPTPEEMEREEVERWLLTTPESEFEDWEIELIGKWKRRELAETLAKSKEIIPESWVISLNRLFDQLYEESVKKAEAAARTRDTGEKRS